MGHFLRLTPSGIILSLFFLRVVSCQYNVKRMVAGSCGHNGNSDTICSPKTGDTWQNGTWYQVTWNPSYPTYVSASSLDIYAYYVEHYQNIPVKSWRNVSVSKGNYALLVDDTWFSRPLKPGSAPVVHDCLLYMVASGINPEKEMNNLYSDFPSPVHINIAQVASSSNTNHSTTVPSDLESTSNSDDVGTKALQPWVIAIIILSSVAVLIACFIIIWILCHVRRRKLVYDEKGNDLYSSVSSTTFPLTPIQIKAECSPAALSELHPSDIESLPPPIMRLHQDATTLSADRKDSVRFKNYSQPLDESDNYIIRPQSAISCSNVSNRSDPPLTSTDALLIADTFRQRMRRPEWQQAQDPAHSKEFLSEEDARQKQEEQEEEERRKKLSQELLKKELAAEGTLMKKVGKRANLSAIIYHADELK